MHVEEQASPVSVPKYSRFAKESSAKSTFKAIKAGVMDSSHVNQNSNQMSIKPSKSAEYEIN